MKNKVVSEHEWLSSLNSDFNFDFRASFRPEEIASGKVFYNYTKVAMGGMTDREGISVFSKNGKNVFHTYSTFARGIDMVNPAYQFLDLVPKGRDEHGRGQFWVRHHDRYKG